MKFNDIDFDFGIFNIILVDNQELTNISFPLKCSYLEVDQTLNHKRDLFLLLCVINFTSTLNQFDKEEYILSKEYNISLINDYKSLFEDQDFVEIQDLISFQKKNNISIDYHSINKLFDSIILDKQQNRSQNIDFIKKAENDLKLNDVPKFNNLSLTKNPIDLKQQRNKIYQKNPLSNISKFEIDENNNQFKTNKFYEILNKSKLENIEKNKDENENQTKIEDPKKEISREYAKKQRIKNKDKISEMRKLRQLDKKQKDKVREYQYINKERIRQISKKQYQNNKDLKKQYGKRRQYKEKLGLCKKDNNSSGDYTNETLINDIDKIIKSKLNEIVIKENEYKTQIEDPKKQLTCEKSRIQREKNREKISEKRKLRQHEKQKEKIREQQNRNKERIRQNNKNQYQNYKKMCRHRYKTTNGLFKINEDK